MHKKETGLTVRLPSGKKRTHGGYSFLTTGKLPEHRRYIEAYLSAARQGMIRDLGPKEEDLTAAQVLLIDRAILKVGVLRCIEEHVRETGVFSGRTFNQALGRHFISYSNSLRLDLQALGIDRRAGEPEMSLAEIIKQVDAENAQKGGQGVPDEDAEDQGGDGQEKAERASGADVENGDADPEGGDE